MCDRIRLLLVVTIVVLGAWPVTVRAQDGPTAWADVFVGVDPDTGEPTVYFVDALSGLSTVVAASDGAHFTLAGDYVIYEEQSSGAIMRARADGTLEPHPFIRRGVDTASVTWITSPDRQSIAWVTVSTGGTSAAYVARADGSDLRQLPITTPTAPLTLVPVAIQNDLGRFVYDAAHTPETESPFAVYDHLVAVDIAAAAFTDLPQEPNCPCGAAFSADGRIFARLEAPEGRGPFALHVWDLPTNAGFLIPAPDLPYRLAGELIVNDTGTLAAYGVATQLEGEGGALEVQYALALVDTVAQQQYAVLSPRPERYRPLAFIDGDDALLLAGVPDGGTYKLNLSTGDIQPVSDKVYLGSVTTP
jgi:hypothetical protein